MLGSLPVLDLIIVPLNSPYLLGVGDMSKYPTGWNIVTPSLQITPPGYNSVVVDFANGNVNVFNSLNLGITCEDEDNVILPDGLYTLKYTITPAYKYFVEKTFMKVDGLLEALDGLYISLDISQCDKQVSTDDNRKLQEIDRYINFAIAAANKCANAYAIESYQKAVKLVNKYQKTHCSTC